MKNNSKKRDAVYNIICSTDTHPTAGWIYEKAKELFPHISLGTVYRNILDLKNDGKVISVGIVDGYERFDGCVQPHTHFVCNKCGTVIDLKGIEVPIDNNRVDLINKQFGIDVISGDLTYRGCCSKCQ